MRPVLLSLLVLAACGSSGAGAGDAGVDAPVEASVDAGLGAPGDASMEAPVDAPPVDADAGTIPVSPGGSGAIGVVTTGGKQKMYLPTLVSAPNGHAQVAVVDVGVPGQGVSGASALLKTIDLGTSWGATTTGGDSTMVVAASQGTRDLWFIDPTTDTLVDHRMLDSTFGQTSFSGLGGGYVTGIVVDSTTHQAILAVWNGFAFVDLASHQVTSVVQAPPSANFGFDSVHGLLYAPFYDCMYSSDPGTDAGVPSVCNTPMSLGDAAALMTDGLSVVRLADRAVFTYEDPSAQNPVAPVGSRPDSAGADPATQLVIVPSEVGGYQNVLDFSQAVFDTATHTVTAPHHIVPNVDYPGVAVDPGNHFAFLEAEGTSNVAVLSLTAANAGSLGWVGATMPNLPNAFGPFNNVGDPHGIAVTASILGGKSVGFLVDSTWHWVARVDLQALASVGQSDASVTATSAQVQAAVTYLDATTPE